MAFRQGSGTVPPTVNGDHKISGPLRSARGHDSDIETNGSWQASTRSNDAATRGPVKPARAKKAFRTSKNRQCSVGFYLVILLCVVALTFLGSDYIGRALIVVPGDWPKDDFFDHPDPLSELDHTSNAAKDSIIGRPKRKAEPDVKELHFGQGFRGREGDRDSRDWDSDDRSRDITLDDGDLEESFQEEYTRLQKELQKKQVEPEFSEHHDPNPVEGSVSKTPGLSYERGRNELRMYEKQYEADLQRESNNTDTENDSIDDVDDEYDGNQDSEVSDRKEGDENGNESVFVRQSARAGKSTPIQETGLEKADQKFPRSRRRSRRGAAFSGRSVISISEVWKSFRRQSDTSPQKYRYQSAPRHFRRGAPCEISFANATELKEPENSSKFAQFELSYIRSEERPSGDSNWRPRFAGHQTMEEREGSFHARKQTICCGFVQGPDPPESTGFDLSQKDMDYLNTCHVAVSSCIFGKSDQLHTPRRKKVLSSSRKEVCFVLFVDQVTLDVMLQEGQVPDENGYVGLWRVVLVKNLPYTDFRRAGKIPKFLAHRLFPSARYSIWLDSKLRLQSDPLLILEYFLWRGNHEYAISNHYDRHCVWDEVQQNKRLNKFNHSLIDEQFLYYQQDGLIRFNASDPKRLLPSYVPEGSFIVRAHTPMSNLFSCLWFNEVDRFTPRDQLSFVYTYMKLVRTNVDQHFRLHMFKDCERKLITKLFRHRRDDRASVQ